jgi:cytochrome P450
MKHSVMVRLQPHIAARANRLIDSFVDRGGCDFHTEFAVPLPGETFLGLFGLPERDLDFLLAFKDNVMRPPGGTVAEQRDIQQEWAGRAEDYIAGLIAQKRGTTGDDVISSLTRVDAGGTPLTDAELVDICFQLTLGGLDTVTAALGHMWSYLATHPERRAALVQDPALIKPAVEELLRWSTPVTAVKRRATRDTEAGGCPIAAGQPVLISIFSADADPARFPHPDEVDFTRQPNRHNAFGGGIHRCLGSHLARIELITAVQQWHARIPDYRITDPVLLAYTDASAIRTVNPLPLSWDPR